MVKVLKLLTGQDVVCKDVTEDINVLRVVMPAELMISPNGSAALRPYTIGVENLSEQSININPLTVVCVTTANKDIENAYNDLCLRLTSNIVQPTQTEKNLILG